MPRALTEKEYKDLIKDKSRLGFTYKLSIDALAKFLVDYSPVRNEEIVGIIGVRHKAKLAFLLLTERHTTLLFLSNLCQNPAQRNFTLDNKNLKINVSENGLKIHYKDSKLSIYFDDNKLAKQFIDEDLSRFVTVEKGEQVLPVDTSELLGGCLSLIFIAGIIMLLLGQYFGNFNEDSTKTNSSDDGCLGNYCWESEEQLQRDVCRVDPSIKGCQ